MVSIFQAAVAVSQTVSETGSLPGTPAQQTSLDTSMSQKYEIKNKANY